MSDVLIRGGTVGVPERAISAAIVAEPEKKENVADVIGEVSRFIEVLAEDEA